MSEAGPLEVALRPGHELLARSALGVGLAALIPLPFVDELVRRRLLRAAFRAAAADEGVALGPAELRVLVGERGSVLLAVLKAVLIWPIKKLFRTLIYALTVKDALDWTTEAALRAEMIHMAAGAGALPARAVEVRRWMDEILARHRTSPVSRWLLRLERPPMRWPRGADPLLGGVGRLVEAGGGGLVLARFEARLRDQSSTSLLGSSGSPTTPEGVSSG